MSVSVFLSRWSSSCSAVTCAQPCWNRNRPTPTECHLCISLPRTDTSMSFGLKNLSFQSASLSLIPSLSTCPSVYLTYSSNLTLTPGSRLWSFICYDLKGPHCSLSSYSLLKHWLAFIYTICIYLVFTYFSCFICIILYKHFDELMLWKMLYQ